ncbi:potassium transporter Trk [Microbacterium sp. LRZ72]|uniref:potassium transporter Trk n=1 Tax=Microbacterium sp. LRZ72 TaxID=2942481 RepID=UPI0029A65008|nr:potassium transporter Trk [Microbacterium sp. LRZ72]MDX2377499.1 potassium transporter Trk [Microbacterium sp. LRZ72]
MSDQQPGRPAPPRDEVVSGRVRRVPKYGVFLAFGVVVGVLVAMILTLTWNGGAPAVADGIVYSQGQVFGFLVLVCATVGVGVAGVVALILDRTGRRHARPVLADHETVVGD